MRKIMVFVVLSCFISLGFSIIYIHQIDPSIVKNFQPRVLSSKNGFIKVVKLFDDGKEKAFIMWGEYSGRFLNKYKFEVMIKRPGETHTYWIEGEKRVDSVLLKPCILIVSGDSEIYVNKINIEGKRGAQEEREDFRSIEELVETMKADGMYLVVLKEGHYSLSDKLHVNDEALIVVIHRFKKWDKATVEMRINGFSISKQYTFSMSKKGIPYIAIKLGKLKAGSYVIKVSTDIKKYERKFTVK